MQHRQPLFIALVLFFFSGVSALIYEILWLKELGLLFGNTSYAMATTLAAFFMGLAAGSYHWGERVVRAKQPLYLYGLLELGVAASALGYFLLLEFYGLIYSELFIQFGNHRALFIFVKFLLAVIVLFPPAYFMGGTLPVISQYVVYQHKEMGRKVSLLYAGNTLGAVIGVVLAGFFLPNMIGYTRSYWLAIVITLTTALLAIAFAKRHQYHPVQYIKPMQKTGSTELLILAFMSGFLTLSLQVLWGNMFAQVLQNSVYTFALVLICFLLCLALGSLFANRLMRSCINPESILFCVFVMGALLVALSPFIFLMWTDNLHFIGSNETWQGYLLQVIKMALVIMGGPLILLGIVFPYLLKLSEEQQTGHGLQVGRLFAYNTVGAIFGSLVAGFFILERIGLWAGIRLVAVVYLLMAIYCLNQRVLCNDRGKYTRWFMFPVLGIILTVSLLDISKLPLVKVDPVAEQESLLEVWEDSAGTVAVVRQGEHLKLKVNNYYTLGGSGSYELERRQAKLPILLHPNPRSVYMLGLGTGISAGGALDYPLKKLVVTELLDNVVTAADKYFGEFTSGLFYDPRVKIVAEDGRNYLRGTNEKFDLIISDLFVPWQASTGNLYALEHFQTVSQRLETGGLFMQWLPAYQLSDAEFKVIVRTMLQVFAQITVWRGDFSALKPVVGLLGQKQRQPLPVNAGLFRLPIAENELPLLTYYIGDMASVAQQYTDIQLNTDDYPLIEFQAPISQRMSKSGEIAWLAGEQLIDFMQQFSRVGDDYLSEIDKEKRQLPEAGMHLHYAQLLKYRGELNAAKQQQKLYQKKLAQGLGP